MTSKEEVIQILAHINQLLTRLTMLGCGCTVLTRGNIAKISIKYNEVKEKQCLKGKD